jgi:hypothetical protein
MLLLKKIKAFLSKKFCFKLGTKYKMVEDGKEDFDCNKWIERLDKIGFNNKLISYLSNKRLYFRHLLNMGEITKEEYDREIEGVEKVYSFLRKQKLEAFLSKNEEYEQEYQKLLKTLSAGDS